MKNSVWHQTKVVKTRTEGLRSYVQHRRAGAVGERVGRQERDQGDGRGITLGGRAGGRT